MVKSRSEAILDIKHEMTRLSFLRADSKRYKELKQELDRLQTENSMGELSVLLACAIVVVLLPFFSFVECLFSRGLSAWPSLMKDRYSNTFKILLEAYEIA